MKVIDPGHEYNLRQFDDGGVEPVVISSSLTFVKREGDNYPGNVGHHSGTTTQEVLRALIDRTKYVDNQIPDSRNDAVLYSLRNAILELEVRAAERHGRILPLFAMSEIELLPTCNECGHIGCEGTCR